MGILTTATLVSAFLHNKASVHRSPSSSVSHSHPVAFRGSHHALAALQPKDSYPDELPWRQTGNEKEGYSKYFPDQKILVRPEVVALLESLEQVIADESESSRSWPLEFYDCRRLVEELQKELEGDEGIVWFKNFIALADPATDDDLGLKGGRFVQEFVTRWEGLGAEGRAEMKRIVLKYLLTTSKQIEVEDNSRRGEEVPANMKRIAQPYDRKHTPLYRQNVPPGPRGEIEKLLEAAPRDIQAEAIMNYGLQVHFDEEKAAAAQDMTDQGPVLGTFFEDIDSNSTLV